MNRPNKDDMLSEHERPGFKSMADQTWRDMSNNEVQRFVVRSNRSEGYQIIDTYNGADGVVMSGFRTENSAHEYLRTNRQR
jgi:hypothetical protein